MKPSNRTERDWHRWGNQDPFFGVITDQKFLTANLTSEARQEFFDTGKRHVQHIYSVIHSKIQANFQAKRILDYGCGVGRLLIPFASRAQTVFGVDISPGMLTQARDNCEKYGASCAHLLHANELDSLESSSFDLVHSFIVFQHIPVRQGERLLRKLIGLIALDGVGAIHFTFSDQRSPVRRAVLAARVHSRLMHGLLNTMQGKAFSFPMMQMNSYSINRVFNILVDLGCANLYTEFSDHGGFRGAMLYFQKTGQKPTL
jgi:2-polyprenyl-3-methyl-5-hydroxy-6-metoxy-1,4-benzoquinol methylase